MVDPSSRTVYAATGQPLSVGQRAQLGSWLADFEALVSSTAANRSLADVAATLMGDLSLSDSSQELLKRSLASDLVVRYSGWLDRLSALYYDNFTSFPGVDDVVLGGYSRIVDYLASGLLDVRLSSPVAGISHNDSFAQVNLTSGLSLTAQYVICTVPLGVLQAGMVALDPAPPVATVDAMTRLGVGLVNKVWLYFDQESQLECHPYHFPGAHELAPLPCRYSGTWPAK